MAAPTAEEVYERYVLPMSPVERQKLLDMLRERSNAPSVSQSCDWGSLAGTLAYPAAGEDAQVWVSRSRKESDESREHGMRTG